MNAIIEKIKQEVLAINEQYKNQAEDGYDYWNNHVKYVVKESLFLAEKYGADKEVVEIAAMLHDIALMKKVGTKADHNINGAKIAKEILDKYEISNSKKETILGCILHHRSSKYAENIEELCVADADIIAHFDNLPMIFFKSFTWGKMTLKDREKLIAGFNNDYDDLSDKTKKEFKQRFENIMQVLFGESICL